MIYQKYIKSFLDFFFALALMLFSFPILIISGVLIFVFMGRPIFFKQERPGKNKKLFTLYKFRTMSESSTLTDGERITKLGYLLRKTSIDELPQLINILFFEMSFIGPRPLLVEYNDFYTNEQSQRFIVKPGISGLAQVSGRNDLEWSEKLNLDINYVQNISFNLDCMIFFKTIQTIFTFRGFKPHGEANKFSDGR